MTASSSSSSASITLRTIDISLPVSCPVVDRVTRPLEKLALLSWKYEAVSIHLSISQSVMSSSALSHPPCPLPYRPPLSLTAFPRYPSGPPSTSPLSPLTSPLSPPTSPLPYRPPLSLITLFSPLPPFPLIPLALSLPLPALSLPLPARSLPLPALPSPLSPSSLPYRLPFPLAPSPLSYHPPLSLIILPSSLSPSPLH